MLHSLCKFFELWVNFFLIRHRLLYDATCDMHVSLVKVQAVYCALIVFGAICRCKCIDAGNDQQKARNCFLESFGSYTQLIGFAAGLAGALSLYLKPESNNEMKAVHSMFRASVALAITGAASVSIFAWVCHFKFVFSQPLSFLSNFAIFWYPAVISVETKKMSQTTQALTFAVLLRTFWVSNNTMIGFDTEF